MPINTRWDASTDDARERLSRQKCWSAFQALKAAFQTGYGMVPADAWQRAYDLLPPPSVEMRVTYPVSGDDDEDDDAGFSVTEAKEMMKDGRSLAGMVAEDVQWIYTHLAVKSVKSKDAPSPGAWFWLNTIRDDVTARSTFFRDTLPKFLPPAKALEAVQRFEDTGAAVIDTIKKCRQAAGLPDIEKTAH